MGNAIEASELRKHYPPDVQALDGIDLGVEEGTIFALLGPNGAGKSTTVKTLTTLTRPDSGTAQVAGHDVLARPERVRRSIGVVGQKHGFDPEATGRENLVLQGAIYDLPGRELRTRVPELLERFGLTAAAGRPAKTYSGGMQRRLDIAMGLIHHPEVLFLDEPTTGLDPEVRADMWQEIARLANEEKMTILLTTHYLEEADELAAQVAIVDRGRVVAEGSPEELKSALQGDALHFELVEAATPAVREALEGVEGLTEVDRRRPARSRPCPQRRNGNAARPCRPRGRRALGGLGDDGTPLARRGVPPARRAVVPQAEESGMTRALRHSWYITLRNLRRLLRQPAWVAITLIQPMIWLLLFGAIFKKRRRDPGLQGRLLHRVPHARGDRADGDQLRRAGTGWRSSTTCAPG